MSSVTAPPIAVATPKAAIHVKRTTVSRRTSVSGKQSPLSYSPWRLIRDQTAKLGSGKAHHAGATPPLTPAQRLVMAASSMLYLCCAAAWWHFGFLRLGAFYCVSSACSVCADSLGGLLPEPVMQRLRMVDRTVGTIGTVFAVAFNCTSLANCAVALAAVATSLCWLAKGRAVAKAEPRARWKYLFFHGMWHAYGAASLVALTFLAQSPAPPPPPPPSWLW